MRWMHWSDEDLDNALPEEIPEILDLMGEEARERQKQQRKGRR